MFANDCAKKGIALSLYLINSTHLHSQKRSKDYKVKSNAIIRSLIILSSFEREQRERERERESYARPFSTPVSSICNILSILIVTVT